MRLGLLALAASFSISGDAAADTEENSTDTSPQVSTMDIGQRMQRAKTLLESRQAEQAYTLLSEAEFDGAGDESFDYLLGSAALDAGKPDKATLALDRVLALNPNHGGALIDRGRAYAALGNLRDARADFDAALKLNPSDATRAQVKAFLAQLERRETALGAQVRAYLAATLGHDSNVNFAASERDVFVPLLQDSIKLSSDSVRQRDAFLGVSGGMSLDYSISPGFAWFGNLDAASKRNKDVHQFHLSSMDARFGPAWKGERFQLRWSFNVGAMQLGDDDYRKQHGTGLEWRFNLSGTKQLVAALQHSRNRYRPADTKIFDTNQSVGLFGLSCLIDEEKQVVVSPYLLGGYENDTGGNLQGDKRIVGGGFSGRFALTASRSLTWNVGAQRGRYSRSDPFFLKRREDKRVEVSLGLNQQLGKSKKWLLRPQINWSQQQSNLAPYDYERTEVGITLRRDF